MCCYDNQYYVKSYLTAWNHKIWCWKEKKEMVDYFSLQEKRIVLPMTGNLCCLFFQFWNLYIRRRLCFHPCLYFETIYPSLLSISFIHYTKQSMFTITYLQVEHIEKVCLQIKEDNTSSCQSREGTFADVYFQKHALGGYRCWLTQTPLKHAK